MQALYVHIPFCLKKCYYCDFVSAIHENGLAERYTTALCRESSLRAEELSDLPDANADWLRAPTVFFGGGTPTTLTVEQLGRILAALKRDFGWREDAEITIEANPRTYVFNTRGALSELRALGFNRLSMGVQSFDDDLLQSIGRTHNAADVAAAVAQARCEGFDNISLDLIFALPGQTLKQWDRTLERAVGLGTEHISLYNLTIEEGTVFGEQYRRGELEPAPSDLEAEMYELAMERLAAAGYEQYEVSNFARAGRRSQHNQVYWRREDYLGIGVGAHSCLRNVRFANGRNTLLHIESIEAGKLPTQSREELDGQAVIGEAMWLGLRLLDGVDLGRVTERFGKDPAVEYGDTIHRLIERRLLRLEGSVLSLTREGLFLGNEVFCQFV